MGLTGGWHFDVEVVSTNLGLSAPRAFLQQDGAQKSGRLYVHIIWQEDWTANPFARSKYIKGKIVYQKLVNAAQYFSRQYEIHDGMVLIADFEEPSWESLVPEDRVKELWELDLRQSLG